MKKPLTKKLFELLALIPLLGGLIACESSKTGFEDAQFGAHPVYTLYEIDGSTRMQSPAAIPNGGNIDTADFGFDDEESDYGGGLTYGDGFAGLRFDYTRIDQSPKGTNILPANYGLIPEGATVRSDFEMDEYRLRYTFQVYEYQDEEQEWWVKVGVGPMLTYQTATFKVRDVTTTNVMRYRMEGTIPMPAGHITAGWGQVTANLMYAYNHDLTLGGDFDGTFQDIEVGLAYEMEDQNLKIFGGWRRHDLPGHKTEDGLRVDVDWKIKGFFLGLEWRF